ITSYEVGYRIGSTGNAIATVMQPNPSMTTLTLTGLTKNMQYSVQVRAVNSQGESDYTAWTTPLVRVLGVPEVPTTPMATAGSGADDKETLTVGWTPPSNNGGSAITSYEVQYRIDGESPATATQGNPSLRSLKISSLTKNKEYQAQVRAVNAQGASDWTAYTSPLVRVVGVPDAPAITSLTVGNAQLTVAWTAPSNTGGTEVTAYFIDWKLASATQYTTQATQGASVRSHTIPNLTNGQAYDVRVQAGNAQGDGAWSAKQTATPATTPGVPTGISLTAGNAQLVVEWTAPSSTGGSPITDYDVQWREGSSGSFTELADTTDSTALTATITGLENGKAYEVQVRAQNARGDGAWSASATGTPATMPAAPAAPSVSAPTGAAGIGRLTVTWAAPSSDGGSPITSYDVQYQVSTTGTPVTRNNISDTSLTIPSLTKDTEYRARVRAVNAQGMSDWSSYSSLARVLGVPDAPAAPTVRRGAMALNVSWNAPSNTGGSPITAYKVQWKEADDAAYGDPMEIAAGTTTARITGLTNDTEYDVRVIAVNEQGDSTPSDAAKGTPTDAPTINFGQATYTIDENAGSPLTLTVTLSQAPDAALSLSYTITGTAAGAETYGITPASGALNFAIGATTADLTLTPVDDAFVALDRKVTIELTIPKDYSGGTNASTMVTITDDERPNARIAIGNSAARTTAYTDDKDEDGSSIIVEVAISHAPLTEFKVNLITSNRTATAPADYVAGPYELTFPAKESDTRSAFIDIEEDTLPEGDETFMVAVAPAANPKTDLGDYYVRHLQGSTGIITINDNEPRAPTDLTLAIQDSALGVSWSAPANAGGGNINGYDVEYRLDDASDWTRRARPNAATTDTIPSLTNGRAYEVRVRARTNLSTGGAWSAVERQAPIGPPAAPATPTLEAGNRQLVVRWAAPTNDGGSEIEDYDVRWRAGSTGGYTTLNDDSPSTALSATITSLTNGQAYEVQVRAENAIRASEWSTAATATPAAVPDKPAVPSLTTGNAELNVSWSVPADTGGSAITGYVLEYKLTSAPSWTNAGHSGTGTSATILLLQNDMEYQVRVRARNALGLGPWSDAATETP
ncbi:MAG: fibronectin type III domain-containing protein, partial [Hyphomicrobiales bacterium]|nr:fibronectin type III domain-containing protein [Hyphomicrobiales bacterium]